ncbi:MAG: tRNA uridine-5-carboxymethylaminomethyl(34) synthesis GTPase MnmE [Lachnospiraceae bacterium]|nr:tRNA uridine-5-carboxymethylaminomethyl(34) synthesis GTPase MnmE [Lachnospiraceae bacterium]
MLDRFNNDTIAAICTGLTGSGINIIRISGEKAFEVADSIFVGKSGKKIAEMRNFSVNYGYIVDKSYNVDNVDNLSEETVDEVLLMKMQAPHSYTKEDVIEIDCHGGIIVTKKILGLILKNGARLAEPGEFTKRAFLNGRIDLSQAEAVIDIINAKSNLALKNSVQQLKGSVKKKIVEIREKLISKTAYIEAALDDPEHISLEGFTEENKNEFEEIAKDLKKLVDTFDEGRLLNEGINTCILGLPNAGKSSLLNALLNEERAIVTDIAGTTRDILRETVVFGDVVLNIIDTAGIRDTGDIIEKIGVDRAKKEAENADLILYVIDLNEGINNKDLEILEEIKDKKTIVVYNKSDLLPENGSVSLNAENAGNGSTGKTAITLSSKTGEGIEELKTMIKTLFYSGSINNSEDVLITNERHRELLSSALRSINNVINAVQDNVSEDFLTIDLMDAYETLGKIIGESVEDDLADRIFKDFCMGK